MLTRRLESTDAAARRRGAVCRTQGPRARHRGGSGGRTAGCDVQGAAREAHARGLRPPARPPARGSIRDRHAAEHRRRVGSARKPLVAKWGYGEEKDLRKRANVARDGGY